MTLSPRDKSTLEPKRAYPERISAEAMATTLSRALAQRVVGNADDAVVFYDLSRLDDVLNSLKDAFPPSALHAVAIKANPAIEVLRRISKFGYGAEVASLGELQIAIAAGFPVEAILFDSPVKTREDLEVALKMGITINANSLEELSRIDTLYSAVKSTSTVGIRINPEMGAGSINATSVAVAHSKFGVSLAERRADLSGAFKQYSWLTGVHLHMGSQGMSRDQLLNGVAAVYDFFVELRESANVRVFNIGGGLPAKYRESDASTHFSDYANCLRQRCPALFDCDVNLITEFGRSVHASCGWVASRIEYVVEHESSVPTLLIHVGADMFLRKAYQPKDWHHDMSVCDPGGRLRTGAHRACCVAGPLCFAGDYLGHDVSLPVSVREGDYLLIHDAGAYTFGMWSIYNSRQFPAILGYRGEGEHFYYLKPRQTLNQIVNFWSAGGIK